MTAKETTEGTSVKGKAPASRSSAPAQPPAAPEDDGPSRTALRCPRCDGPLAVVADGVAPRRALVYRPWRGEAPAPGSTDRPGTSLTWRTFAWCPACAMGVRVRTQMRMDTPTRRR